MNTRNISWEIIVAGLAFIGIAIFLLNRTEDRPPPPPKPHKPADTASAPHPPMPPSIVIDLQNLQNLKDLDNLRNLKNLDNLENLEVELRNLDDLIKKHAEVMVEESTKATVHQSLEKLKKHFREFENGDFDVKLQNNKVFINRKFDVKEAAWSEVSPGVFVYRRSFDISSGSNLGLDLGFGNVNIVGVDSSGGEIVLQATGDVEDPQRLDEQLGIRAERRNGDTSFSVFTRGDNWSDRVNLEATVKVPRQTNFNANTSGGHISATHLQGDQRFVTSGGHITLDDLSGTTYAKTSGGHITSDQISGDITLATSGGHIKLEQASGQLDLSTGGGHISIEQWSGQGQAKTSGGNISAHIAELQGPVELNTSAGNISMMLPQSVNADIMARGSETSISDAFNFSGSKTQGKIEGAINGGGIPINASCGYGNISISIHD